MPGFNTTGQPDTSDIVLGRGALYFAALDAITGKPKGFRHLGNATAFNLTMETETLEHQSSRTGVRSIDREVILSQKAGVSVTLDENSYQNLALWFSGTATAAVTNPAQTTQTGEDINGGDDVSKTFSYELVDAAGDRLMDLTQASVDLVVTGSTTGTLTPGTDYTVDAKWGTIFIPSTSTVTGTESLTYDYTTDSDEQPIDQVDLLTLTSVTGFLRFIQINAANSDVEEILDLHSVTLKADGEMQRIGDEFAAMTLTGSAERNETGYPLSPVGRFYSHADA